MAMLNMLNVNYMMYNSMLIVAIIIDSILDNFGTSWKISASTLSELAFSHN